MKVIVQRDKVFARVTVPTGDVDDYIKTLPEDIEYLVLKAEDVPKGDVLYWTDAGIVGAVLPDSVNAERARRVLSGSTFTLDSGKAVALTGDETTKTNLQALAFAASLRIAQDAGSSITLFRDANDFVHELTQAEVLELWTKSAAFVSAMFQAAWFLKDGPSIPQDYTDNKYWSA